MLERDLERIAAQLTQGILASLRSASLDELAAVLPEVRKLLQARDRRPAASAPRKTTEKPSPRKSSAAPPRPAPRDGALGEQIVRVLSKAGEGMRSEQLQLALHVDTLPLRAMLAELVAAGRLTREGQARGTRYLAVAQRPRQSAPPPAPVVVDVDAMNGIRAHLAGSTVPLSLPEIEERSQLSRTAARAAIEKLVTLGFASRHGHGPGVRYHLATRAPQEQSAASEGPRVVRRPPRAKTWTTAPAEANPATSAPTA